MNPPANSAQQPASNHHEDDVKSIGHYTGLETLTGLNLRENDDDEKNEERPKCTCSCTCEVCTAVRKYREAKEMGIDYNLNGHLAYLGTNCSPAHHVHDLREHNVEIENYDDLIRLLPDSKLVVAIVTFNMNGRHCSTLNDLLLPDSLDCFPDVYAVGVQEFFRDQNEVREHTIELQVLKSLVYFKKGFCSTDFKVWSTLILRLS